MPASCRISPSTRSTLSSAGMMRARSAEGSAASSRLTGLDRDSAGMRFPRQRFFAAHDTLIACAPMYAFALMARRRRSADARRQDGFGVGAPGLPRRRGTMAADRGRARALIRGLMFKIAIIGSGPSGLSAAAHAAELGIAHVLLESEQHAADTIYKYQKGKYVMAEPNVLPLRSPMPFAAGTREQVLAGWDEKLSSHAV